MDAERLQVPILDDMFKKLTMETMKEFDWCLDQLDTLKASMSISEMASNKVICMAIWLFWLLQNRRQIGDWYLQQEIQLAFACSKLTMETWKQCAKYAQSSRTNFTHCFSVSVVFWVNAWISCFPLGGYLFNIESADFNRDNF